MKLSVKLGNSHTDRQHWSGAFLLFLFTLILKFLQVESVTKGVGGFCISYAQSHCLDLSNPLYLSMFQSVVDNTQVCRDFKAYHNCIEGITSQCSVTKEEKLFYDKSFVQFFKTTYECYTTTTGALQRQSNPNSARPTKQTYIVMVAVTIIGGFLTCWHSY